MTQDQPAVCKRQLRRDIAPACATIAKRLDDGTHRFIDVLTELGDINESQARHALAVMLHLRVAKQDLVSGDIRVKHGAYLDRDAIRNAVAYVLP